MADNGTPSPTDIPTEPAWRAFSAPFLLTMLVPATVIFAGYLPAVERHLPVLALGAWMVHVPFAFTVTLLVPSAAALWVAWCAGGVLLAGYRKVAIDPRQWRRLGMAVGVMMAIPVAALAIRLLLPPVPAGSWLQPFDTATWNQLNSFPLPPYPRQQVIGDLTRNVLPGMMQTQILEILGEPDISETSPDGMLLYYITGPWRVGLPYIDDEMLVIKLDGEGRYRGFYLRPT